MRHLLLLAICALALSGCAERQMGRYFQPSMAAQLDAQKQGPKVVFVTIDGTSNTLTHRTNPGRLHEIVESYSYQYPGRPIATFYAEGVGSGDAKLLALIIGTGVNDDIKRSYAFLTRVWQPDDALFFNGFSRGAYTLRALGGLIYMAGIPDLSGHSIKRRNKIVNALFGAYKTSAKKGETPLAHAQRRADLIAEVVTQFDLQIPAPRQGGFGNPQSKAVIKAMSLWDSVAALGTPNGTDDPLASPSRYLLTNCNVENLFHALSLDDNRARSFTPILAKGPKTLELCPDNRASTQPSQQPSQRVNSTLKEVWFSGAHADVGGTYDYDFMLDGELPSVALNWVLEELEGVTPALFPKGLRVPEDRMSLVHDGDFVRKPSYKRSRKPSLYSKRAYKDIAPITLHASVYDRLEQLFALDKNFARCSGPGLKQGPDLLCAEQLATYSLVPELYKLGCIEVADWGYRVISNAQNPQCPQMIGQRRASSASDNRGDCPPHRPNRSFTGWVYDGLLEEVKIEQVQAFAMPIPFPNCFTPALDEAASQAGN